MYGADEKRELNLLQPWSDFDPSPLVGTSIFLVWRSEPTLAIWNGLEEMRMV